MSVSSDRMYLQLQDGTILPMRSVNGVIQVSSNGTDWADLSGGGTVTTDTTLTGDGSISTPLGINPSTVAIMSDVVSIAGGAVTDLTLSGLSGETDGNYQIDFNLIVQGAGTIQFNLRPFGTDETSLLSNTLAAPSGGGAVTCFGQQTGLVLGYASSGGVQMRFLGRAFLVSKSGAWRFFESTAQEARAAPIYEHLRSAGHSSDTTTAITALTIHADVASSILTGSKMKVRKLASIL